MEIFQSTNRLKNRESDKIENESTEKEKRKASDGRGHRKGHCFNNKMNS